MWLASNWDIVLAVYALSFVLMRQIVIKETSAPAEYDINCMRHNDFLTAVYIVAPLILAIMLIKRTINVITSVGRKIIRSIPDQTESFMALNAKRPLAFVSNPDGVII